MNYYNEHDHKAAQWLRQLIAAGLIPAGEVDERDIQEVQPHELTRFTQCHFFAGIGGWSLALQLAGWPANRPVWTGSCPCQPFSTAGKGKGVEDERHLWPVFRELIRQCRPSVVFGEQVASKAGREWLSGVFLDLEGMAYRRAGADLCAAGVRAPHIRQRLWWVADTALSPAERLRPQPERLPGPADDRSPQRVADSGCRCLQCQRKHRELAGKGGEPQEGPHQRERRGHASGDSGTVGRLADSYRGECAGLPSGEGCEPDRKTSGRQQGDSELELSCLASGLAIAQGERCDGAAGTAESAGRGIIEAGCGMVHALGAGLEGHAGDGIGGDQSGRLDPQPLGSVAAASGPWDCFDLLPCTDGKARRVEPGTFPLAHGLPGRVGLLRGYGNAIVPEVAATFVWAYLETEREG